MKSKNRSIQLSRIFIENGFNFLIFWRFLKKCSVNDFILASYMLSHPNTTQKCKETHCYLIFHSDSFWKHSVRRSRCSIKTIDVISDCRRSISRESFSRFAFASSYFFVIRAASWKRMTSVRANNCQQENLHLQSRQVWLGLSQSMNSWKN